MLVYGDHTLSITLGQFLEGLQTRFTVLPDSLEEARVRLIFAGQLQQAAEDANFACAEACRQLTDAAAISFLQALDGSSAQCPVAVVLRRMRAAAKSEERRTLHLRAPEGFAWYSLYPDAYVQSARNWLRDHAASRVLVVGIRSIGTSLAAVTAATLRSYGFQVETCTVRPTGHPFGRQTQLPEGRGISADHAIVVDEGPGLSGSSMASVAEALTSRGFTTEEITFFPGHAHGPGRQSSTGIRRWWNNVNQVTVAWDKLKVGEQGAVHRLKVQAARALNDNTPCDLADVGAGQWLVQAHCPRPILGVAPTLEQPKYLARSSVSGQAVLLKFSGFNVAAIAADGQLLTASEHCSARQHALAEGGFTVAPIASIDGWLIFPWLNGRTLRAHDASGAMLERIAAYISRASTSPLSNREADDALCRLERILLTNSDHLLGRTAREQAERASVAVASAIKSSETRSYGDGRLAPHEWIDTGQAVLKLDAVGHSSDHTAVGPQSVLWDVAGAAVDWQLSHDTALDLAVAVCKHHISNAVLSYYCAAYAAFRSGLVDTCLAVSWNETERADLAMARDIYSARLRLDLDRMDALLHSAAT